MSWNTQRALSKGACRLKTTGGACRITPKWIRFCLYRPVDGATRLIWQLSQMGRKVDITSYKKKGEHSVNPGTNLTHIPFTKRGILEDSLYSWVHRIIWPTKKYRRVKTHLESLRTKVTPSSPPTGQHVTITPNWRPLKSQRVTF